ncbi:uncharacterized protein LOC118768466 [Octopus sinensis]|uniref:Uncharacterized protein LOC118768466 n=1 Tax=Octopus sinensis TaxID=2607531 RepID=A0A7E6FTB2_9MOLL|nr:uncharacterized protein LOC118768466 [Octopus sinensis]
MEGNTGNTSRILKPQKTSFCDEGGVYNQKCRYWRDDILETETSQNQSSYQPTTKQDRHKEDCEKCKTIGRRVVLDKCMHYTRFNAYEDKINMLVNSREKICAILKSVGLDKSNFLKDFTQRIEILQKNVKKCDYSQDFIIFGQLECFLEQYVKKNVLQHKHRSIEAPKITDKFRPLCPVVTREAMFTESDEGFSNIISNIVVIQGGVVTYSRHYMTVCCVKMNGNRNEVHCPSSVTDFTRIGKDTVLATLPFRKIILIISPSSLKIQTLQLGFYRVSYLEHSTVIGVEMFGKTVNFIDWEDSKITKQFLVKEAPSAIVVGPQNKLLLSFSNTNIVACYNLDGQQIFEVCTHSLELPTNITAYQNHFYVLQGHIIYKLSGTGGMSKKEIGVKGRNISVDSSTIFLVDYFGIPHAVRTTEDFWPRLSYSNQLHTPTFYNQIYVEDYYDITNILPMSTSSMLIISRNKKAILFTDIGGKIRQNYSSFPFFPSVFCRLNSKTFLIFYSEIKALQYVTCPELTKIPLIKVHAEYIKICHIVSNKCLAVTTTENKVEVHIMLIKEDQVDIMERISLGHENVTIAATPINFVVVDGKKNKLVFYSTCGEELFEKSLPCYGYPHHIYSDNVYYYVVFKRESVVICYNIFGEIKWQWKLPLTAPSHIAVSQGTVYAVDLALNRVLLFKCHDGSSCSLRIKNPYIRNLNIQLKEKEEKLLIAKICHLPNGQLVVSDINNDCLFYISKEGDIVSRLSLPSAATDICQWDCNQIGITLPLERQLRVIENLSKAVRTVSFTHPYVRVCKLGNGQMVSYCDKPSHLDILNIKNYNQVEIIHRINIPFVVKSLSIDKETLKLLIVTRKKVFQYNGSGGSGSNSKMVPSVLLSHMKPSLDIFGGCIDKLFVYLIDNSRMFAMTDHNLVVRDHITNKLVNMYADLVDVFSRNICVGEMLSSTLYLEDLTVSEEARHIDVVPPGLRNREPMRIDNSIITENNLIAVYDSNNKNIMIFTFDGQLLDSVKLNVSYLIDMCQWQSNTLAIMTGGSDDDVDDDDNDDDSGDDNDNDDDSGEDDDNDGEDDDNDDDAVEHQLLTLKVEFPLSFVNYQTSSKYCCIASLSNNQLVCSKWRDECNLYVVDIDEIHLTVNENKQIDIPEILTRYSHGGSNYINEIYNVVINANDAIIVHNKRFIIFFNSDGQYLHSVRTYRDYFGFYNVTLDDGFLFIHGWWERYFSDYSEYKNIVCLTQNGEYNRIFLNKRIYKDKVDFSCINCKGPRFIGSYRYNDSNKLYVEGLFKANRERFDVCRLQTDNCPVQVKDLDISDDGQIVVCEKANNGNVKIFDRNRQLLCHRDIGSLVGGVCFTGERDIIITVPDRQEIFQLKQQDLVNHKVWESQVPYGVIWRKVGNIYWCVHINLSECHWLKIDGDQLEVLESISLSKLDSGLRFPSISSQTNNEMYSSELIKLKYRGEDGEERGRSGEIDGKGRFMVRCGNYIAESMSGFDEISVRKLPYRTAMVPLSIPSFEEPVDYDIEDAKDYNSKLIKLDEKVSVFMFRNTVTVITATGDILQHKQLPQPQPPLDICWWTDECFIVAFGEQLMFFERDLCRLKTINTKKYYNRIYKHSDNQLVCGGHEIGDRTKEGRCCYNYYVDIVDIDGGTCKYNCGVCSGVDVLKKERGVLVCDIAVTSGGDIVIVKWKDWQRWSGGHYLICWYRDQLLVRSIKLQPGFDRDYIYRPCLNIHGEYVYITDIYNNIYQIPGDIPHETAESIKQYLFLDGQDNEVFTVLGFGISDNSFFIFGIIPGRQSFAFFHYDK